MPEETPQQNTGKDAPPGASRKPMTPSERARHASLVRWGKEQPFAARLEAVRQRRKAAKQKKAKGKGKTPKAAKPTAAEKEAERARQMQANVEAVGEALNESDNATLSKNGLAGLISAANGEEPGANVAQGLIDKGLAVRGEDGRYRLTSDGQAIVRAAEAGDTSAVLDRLSAVNDKNVTATEKEKAKAEKEKEKAEKQGKGGGGGGGKEKPTEEEKAAEKAQKKADNRASVGKQLAENDADLSERGLEALASLASGEEVDEALVDGLVEMGLVEVDSEGRFRATVQGRAAVRAAERGDYGATVDAVSRAKDRKAKKEERDKAKKERQSERRRREDERRAREDERRAKEDGEEEGDTGRREREDDLPTDRRKPRDNRGPMKAVDLDDVYRRYHETVNMSASELESWAETDASRRASLDRSPIRRNLRLLRKPKAEWTAADIRNANRTISFVSRMRGAEQGKPANKDTPYSKRDISLRNWAYNPDGMKGRSAQDWALYGKSAIKHGAHDQSSHGKRGARGKAAGAAYRSARAGGATVQEARAAANDVSQIHANQQRISNIDRQLQGEISDKQRTSLAAERDRLVADNTQRAARVHPGATEQANAAYNANPAPTVRGRAGALYEFDQQLSVSRARRDETRGALEQARRDLQWRESAAADAQTASTSIRRQYEKERNEARREVARLEKQLKGYERAVERNRGLYEGELARPAFSQRRQEIYAERERLRAYNPDYGKSLETDTMSNYTPLLDDLETLCNEAHEIVMEDEAEIKAGRRNNATDQAEIDRGYAMAEELCSIFEALGAETGEEMDEDDMPGDEMMSGKSIDYEREAQRVREAWYRKVAPQGAMAVPTGDAMETPHCVSVYDDAIVICHQAHFWRVPYTNEGEITFAERSEWEEVQPGYVATKAQRTFGGKEREDLDDSDFAGPDRTFPIMTAQDVRDAAKLIGKADDPEAVKRRIIAIAKRKGFEDAIPAAWGTTKGVETFIFDGEEVTTLPGYSIKAVGDGQTEGYLVRFGGDGDLSEWRDVFDRDTDYGRATKSDVWVHHRMLPGLGKRRLTNQAEIGMDDEGVFIKHLLNLRSSYERKLYGLAQQGKLGWSSGTAPHLVERKSLGDGRHKIEQWPLGLDASYTPMPAGGLDVEARASAMKSLFVDAGIDLLNAIYDSPEVQDSEEARPDAVKASETDRARRLLLQSKLLQLQE